MTEVTAYQCDEINKDGLGGGVDRIETGRGAGGSGRRIRKGVWCLGGERRVQDENRSSSPSREAKERAAKRGFDKSKCPVQTEGGPRVVGYPVPPAADDAQALCKIAELSIWGWGKTALTALAGGKTGANEDPRAARWGKQPLSSAVAAADAPTTSRRLPSSTTTSTWALPSLPRARTCGYRFDV